MSHNNYLDHEKDITLQGAALIAELEVGIRIAKSIRNRVNFDRRTPEDEKRIVSRVLSGIILDQEFYLEEAKADQEIERIIEAAATYVFENSTGGNSVLASTRNAVKTALEEYKAALRSGRDEIAKDGEDEG